MGTSVRPPLPPETGADALVGAVLEDRYEIIARIARGGMATVYEAVDARLDRTVAIKVMHRSLAEDPDFVTRFRREARAAARLSHPCVVAVYDQGEADDLPYLVMEYVPGRTLRDVLAEHGPLRPEQALTILEPVLAALAAAHDAGFVHRDVKPENVLISDDGQVKVTDFGLARAVTSVTAATQGFLIGTVAYLSPEHVEQGTADARSDVYGAGICLFEMVTGQVPYGGENPLSVAYQHVNADVPEPSRLVPGLPPEIDALVVTATRRDPAARYPDCHAFLDDVRRVRRVLPSPRPLARRSPDGPQDTLVVAEAVGAMPGDRVAATTALPAVAAGRGGGPANERGVAARSPRRRSRRGWLIAVLFLAMAVAGAAVGGWYLAAGPGKTVTVPGILGLDPAAAEAALAEQGLGLEIAGEEFSETVAAGLILAADPEPGAGVRTGSTIAVIVSRGPERFVVPGVVGLTLDAATAALAEANLALGSVTEAFDAVVPAGEVISSDPAAGESLRADSAVSLVVSKGPRPVRLPDLSGTPADEAVTTLEDAGLVVTTTEEYSYSIAEGLVVSSSPGAGTRVEVGGSVTLVVSLGPPFVEVPDVVGMARQEAIDLLDSLGFIVQVNEPPLTPLGQVVLQDPSPGESIRWGSTITITVI